MSDSGAGRGWSAEKRKRVLARAYGQCVSCAYRYKLRLDGAVRLHGNGLGGCCSGSLRLPAHHVHACDCGACWDEEVYA